MAITSSDIRNVRFGAARPGYDPQEVDAFLEKIAEELDRLNLCHDEPEKPDRWEAIEKRLRAMEEQLKGIEETQKDAMLPRW